MDDWRKLKKIVNVENMNKFKSLYDRTREAGMEGVGGGGTSAKHTPRNP